MSNMITKNCVKCSRPFNVFVFWRHETDTCTWCLKAELKLLNPKPKAVEVVSAEATKVEVKKAPTAPKSPVVRPVMTKPIIEAPKLVEKPKPTTVVGITSDAIIYKVKPTPKVSRRLSSKYGDINKLSQRVLDRYK